MLACETDEDANCSVSTPFDFGVRLGLVFVVEAASLSALAVVGLLAYIGVRMRVSFAGCGHDQNAGLMICSRDTVLRVEGQS